MSKPRPLDAERCSYRCPYYMDGPVLSLCRINDERLVYNGSVPPRRTERCKQGGNVVTSKTNMGQLRAEFEAQALCKDAERYRWLRDGGNDDIGVVTGFDCVDIGSTGVAGTYREGLEGEHLDKAIDAAMEEQE